MGSLLYVCCVVFCVRLKPVADIYHRYNIYHYSLYLLNCIRCKITRNIAWTCLLLTLFTCNASISLHFRSKGCKRIESQIEDKHVQCFLLTENCKSSRMVSFHVPGVHLVMDQGFAIKYTFNNSKILK